MHTCTVPSIYLVSIFAKRKSSAAEGLGGRMEETPLLANVDDETIALVEVRATYIYTDTDTCERVRDALRLPSPGDVELMKGALEELLAKHDMR